MNDVFNVGEGQREQDVFGAAPAAGVSPARTGAQPTPALEIEVFDGGPSPAAREARASASESSQVAEAERPLFDGGAAPP
jgi:hypothetical protein